jgi:hypothetical protein
MTCRKPALTIAQLAVEDLLTRLNLLEVGQEVILKDRAQDGFGGLRVRRKSKYSFIFQRTGFKERSRWADRPDEVREEIEEYFSTGKLREPDNIKGW